MFDISALRLKEMDPALLAMTVVGESRARFGPEHGDRIAQAVSDAAYLHRNASRAERGRFSRTPYIEHPLRVALRLLRWGVDDPGMIVAAVLHDVIEDCADELTGMADKDQAREQALLWAMERYGNEVCRMLAGLSNPVWVETHDQYRTHVVAEIGKDARVLMIKCSDIVDNAGSLHHLKPGPGVTRRAAKYGPLMATMIAEVRSQTGDIVSLTTGDSAVANMLAALRRVSIRLDTLAA